MSFDTKKAGKAVKSKQKQAEAVKGKIYFFFYAASFIAILTGIIFAIKLKWFGDDIFIGLRYIENFLEGKGLVYNAGEHVEGYTDFLWLMIISLFQYLKFDPAETSMNLGVVFSAATMLVVAYISFKQNVERAIKYFIPLSLFMLAVNFDFAVWSTSGLETIFYTFLMVAAFAIYFFTKISRDKRLLISGFIMSLALLTRPDSLMFFGLTSIFLFARNLFLKVPFKKLVIEQLLFSAAFILIYIPYFAWRYNYYGLIFPNTYYSKAGYESYYSRGFYYLWTYFQCHFTTFLYLLVIPVLFVSYLKKWAAAQGNFRNTIVAIINDKQLSAFILSVTCISTYLIFFIAKVGGDFMYARFIIPCLPLIWLAIEYSLFALPAINFKKRYWPIVILLIVLGITESSIRPDFFLIDENGKKVAKEKEGIADERYVYVYQYKLDNDKKIGQYLKPYFKNLDATVLVRGGQACFVYYADFKTCLENHGLTDTLISHQTIKQRGGKIAHEKAATYDYMIQRGVDFVFRRSAYKTDPYRFCQFNVGGYGERAEMITYDRKLIAALKERFGADFMFNDFEAYLDNYIRNVMPGKIKDELKKDYEDFRQYYFLHNDDKARESQFLSRI